MSFTQAEILSQLDRCAREIEFPMLDNGYVYPADVRLNAYRSEENWAIIIEDLGCLSRARDHGTIANRLHVYGNCLKRKPGTAVEDFLFPTGDGTEGPLFDAEYGWYINENAQTIRIRDQIVTLDLTPASLEAKGIQLEIPPSVTSPELLRSLLPENRDLLLATEAELLARLSEPLPLFLRIDAWHHPDIANHEMPSQVDTFVTLALALETGFADRVHFSNSNTHWSNWPDGGSL